MSRVGRARFVLHTRDKYQEFTGAKYRVYIADVFNS